MKDKEIIEDTLLFTPNHIISYKWDIIQFLENQELPSLRSLMAQN